MSEAIYRLQPNSWPYTQPRPPRGGRRSPRTKATPRKRR